VLGVVLLYIWGGYTITMYIYNKGVPMCMYVCMYVYVLMYMYVYVLMYMYVCICIDVCVCMASLTARD